MDKNFLTQKVPTHFAFSLMLILSFLVALYTVSTAQKIAEEAKNSTYFDVKKRMEASGNFQKSKNNDSDEPDDTKNPEKKMISK